MMQETGGTWTWAAMLLKYDRNHSIKQGVGVGWALPIFPTFLLLHACQLVGDSTVRFGHANTDIYPYVRAIGLRDVQLCEQLGLPELQADSRGSGMAFSEVAMVPVLLVYSTKKSLSRLCLISLARLPHQATCLPSGSIGALHGCLAPGSCFPHRCPVPGVANPHLKGPFATLVNGAVGRA